MVQAPYEIVTSEPTTRDSAGDRSPKKEDTITFGNHDLTDKDSGFRYLSSVVTECLVSHNRCTGSYVSEIAACIIRCRCSCHSKTHL